MAKPNRRKSKTVRKVGRPKVPIDTGVVERLAQRQASIRTIAHVVGVDEKTLRNRMKDEPDLSATIERARERGKAALLDKQWEQAMGGNWKMQIWLGKQYLDQRDQRREQREEKVTVEVTSHKDELARMLDQIGDQPDDQASVH
jgi:hypothetical protein